MVFFHYYTAEYYINLIVIFISDDISLIAYCLLPHILPSTARKMVDNTNDRAQSLNETNDTSRKPKRRRTVKASDLDSRNSMIIFRSVLNDLYTPI